VGVERQANIHTNIQTHTHFSENNFRKPGARPQPAVDAWFKKELKQAAEMKHELSACILIHTLAVLYSRLK